MDHGMVFWLLITHEKSFTSHGFWAHAHSVIHVLIVEERSWRINSPWAIHLHRILWGNAMIIIHFECSKPLWLVEFVLIMVHYHEFILALFEHLMEDLWVVDSVIVLDSCKLSGCLSVSCHVI
jgi:hypothetical protein